MTARVMASDYMHFAKTGAGATFNLATSGVANVTLPEIHADFGGLRLNGDNSYGYAPLVERIAGRFAIPTDTVVTAIGTAFANFLALSALVEPGDEVLIEAPTYELIASTLGHLRAGLKTFARSPADQWRLDPDAIAAHITPRTRLVVVTNLHNPSSALSTDAEIAAVAEACGRVGAVLLVDEVYRELLFRDSAASTSFRPDGNIVVTSSLTKAYGVSGLRCGWILAPAALAQRMRRLGDLFHSTQPHVSEQLSVAAFDTLETLRATANARLDANRAAYRDILGGHPALDQTVFAEGTTVFPRLRRGDGDALFDRLKRDFDTSIVPGRFFGAADHIRIGLGADVDMTRAGLLNIAAALR